MSRWRDVNTYLDNLSIGAGRTISSGLDATLNALRNPRQAAQGMVQGAQEFAADPMGSIQATAQDFGDKLSSGPMGVGEALGSLIPTPGRLPKLPKPRELIIVAPPGKKGGGAKSRETINERVRTGQGPKDPALANKGSLTGNAYYEKKQARMNQDANDYGGTSVPAQPGGGTAVNPAISARRREVREGLDAQDKLKRDLAAEPQPQQMRGSMARTIDRYVEMARKQNPQGYEETLLPMLKPPQQMRGSTARTIDRYVELARKENPQGYQETLLPMLKALRDKKKD